MDTFLDKNDLPKLNQKDTENQNKPIICNEKEEIIKPFQQRKSQNQKDSQLEM